MDFLNNYTRIKMKKIYVISLILLSLVNIAKSQVKSQVNECFELTSIVFRLAEANEYVNNQLENYTTEIDVFFSSHKNHKLISFIKEIREKNGIAYDAIAVAAGCVDIINGKVVVNSQCDVTKISEIDNRWSEQNFKTYVSLLNDFYIETRFHSFFEQHDSLYRLAEDRMNELLADYNFDWFNSIFGEELKDPIIVVSLCNGPHNYAYSTNFNVERFGIVIGCAADSKGEPFFNRSMTIIITHELLHHYINPRISLYWNQIDSVSNIIYTPVKDKMAAAAYSNAKTTMTEWFVNLLSIMYEREKTGWDISHLIRNSQIKGFIWMERSILFMEHFIKDRKQYATIDDYMPHIIKFIQNTAAEFDIVLNEFDNRHPYVVDIFPISGSTIESHIDTIKIRFSEPMFGSHGIKAVGDENIFPPFFIEKPSWIDDYTFIIILDKSKHEKGKTYGFKLNYQFFQSAKTYGLKEDYKYLYTF